MFFTSGKKSGAAVCRSALFCLFLFLAAAPPAWTQDSTAAVSPEIASLVGLRLNELVARFGAPQTVYAIRGREPWQDDVVFVYSAGDFYLFKDRVWQVSLKDSGGVAIGDSKAAVALLLGTQAVDNGDHVIVSLPSTGWPLALRVNFNASDRVAAIYIYRGDY